MRARALAAPALWALALRFLPLPSIVNPDSIGYFAYLPGLFYSGHLQFLDAFRAWRIHPLIGISVSPTGYVATWWQAGSAVLWSPFFAAAKATAFLAGGPRAVDGGWGSWFWSFVGAAALAQAALSAALALWLLRRRGLREAPARAAAACAFFGAPAAYYWLVVPTMAHGAAAFAGALCAAGTLATRSSAKSSARWLLCGLLAGLAAAVRMQNAPWLLFPLCEWAAERRKEPRLLLPLLAGFLLGASPQLLVSKVMTGSFLDQPGRFNLALENFAPLQTLFSPYHGILWWTPLWFVAAAGLVLGWRRPEGRERWPLAAFLGVMAVDLAVSCFCLAWWQCASFGQRYMSAVWIAMAAGTGEWMRRFRSRPGIAYGVPAACAAWTGLLLLRSPGLNLEVPLRASDMLAIQSSGLSLPGAFASPGPLLLALLAAACWGFTKACAAAFSRAEKGRPAALLAALLLLVLAFDAAVLRSDARRPEAVLRPGEGVPYERHVDDFVAFQRARREALEKAP